MRLTILVVLFLIGAVAAPWALLAQDRGGPAAGRLSGYEIRIGDTVELGVYEHENLSRSYSVPASGEVTFPAVGKIRLAGRTEQQVQEHVRQRLIDEEFLQDPKVHCIVTDYAPRKVYIYGAVMSSYDLPVHRDVRILELLAEIGGLATEAADFSRVSVRRVRKDGQPYSFSVDVQQVLRENREDKNIVIFEGDYIEIPKLSETRPLAADFVYVLGKVGSPGRHPIIPGPTPFTLTKLIAIVGDFQEFADRSKVRIIRTTPTGRQPFEIDFDDIIEGKRADFELQADDLVYVTETWI